LKREIGLEKGFKNIAKRLDHVKNNKHAKLTTTVTTGEGGVNDTMINDNNEEEVNRSSVTNYTIKDFYEIYQKSWSDSMILYSNHEWINERKNALRNASVGSSILFISVCIRKLVFKI